MAEPLLATIILTRDGVKIHQSTFDATLRYIHDQPLDRTFQVSEDEDQIVLFDGFTFAPHVRTLRKQRG